VRRKARSSNIDENTVAYHIQEPLGVVGPDHSLELPHPDGGLEAGTRPGRRQLRGAQARRVAPRSPSLVLAELIADLLPPGVLNIVNGYGREAGMPLATSKRIAKIAFTGSTTTGRVIAQAAANNLIPATLELGGKSPNVFFADVMDKDDAFLDKAIEGLVLFAFNQGEVCTCPSRALIQESIYDKFMERVLKRVAAIKHVQPAGHRQHDRRAGLQRAVDQDPELPGPGQARRRRAADRRRPSPFGWRPGRRLLRRSPPCSRATTRCASSRKKSSAPCWP